MSTRASRMMPALVSALALGLSGCSTTAEVYGYRSDPVPARGGAFRTQGVQSQGRSYPPAYDRAYRSQPTAAEQRLRNESQALANTSAQACLTVGAVSALGAYLLSRKNDRRVAGNVALAGIAGCGIGVGVNSYVQSRRQQYASNEQRLQVMIQELRADNQRLAGLVDTTRQVVAEDRAKVDAIERAMEAKHLTVAEAEKRMGSVTDNRDHLYKTLATLETKQRQWQEVSARERQGGVDTAALDREIARLEAQIGAIKKEIELLDARIEISPVAA